MLEKQNRAASPRESNLVEKFKDKPYRDSYVASHTRRFLARQMRKFRGEKSQAEFGKMIDKRQTVVSRLEDPKYGKWTLQTLFEVAAKLDVAVIVRFVDFSTFLKLTNDMSEEASRPTAYDQKAFEGFSTVATLADPLGGPGALTITMSNLPVNQSLLCEGTLGFYQTNLERHILLNAGWRRLGSPWGQIAREATPEAKKSTEELIARIRPQNMIADTPRIGVHQ